MHRSSVPSATLWIRKTPLHTSILLLQQHWVVRSSIKSLGGLFRFRNRDSVRPRACIASEDIKLTPMLYLCESDISADLLDIGRLIVVYAHLPGDREQIHQRRKIDWWITVSMLGHNSYLVMIPWCETAQRSTRKKQTYWTIYLHEN